MSPEEREESGAPPQHADVFDEKNHDMLTTPILEPDLYETIQAFADARAASADDRGLLQDWINRYPEFQNELRAVSWQIWAQGPDWLNADELGSAEEDMELTALGRGVMDSLLPHAISAPPLTSLLAAAKAKGLSNRDLAEALHLDIPLLARLEQRLIRAASLPRLLVEQMAQTLDRSVAEVAAYLRGGASLAAGAHYKAQQAPSAGSQVGFAEVLTRSSADVRIFWQEAHDVLGEDEGL